VSQQSSQFRQQLPSSRQMMTGMNQSVNRVGVSNGRMTGQLAYLANDIRVDMFRESCIIIMGVYATRPIVFKFSSLLTNPRILKTFLNKSIYLCVNPSIRPCRECVADVKSGSLGLSCFRFWYEQCFSRPTVISELCVDGWHKRSTSTTVTTADGPIRQTFWWKR